MSKQDNSGEDHILIDDTLKIPRAKLELCLVHFYDQVFESGRRKTITNIFWICASSALSMLIMFVTSDFKPVLGIPANIIQIIMLIIEVILVVFAVLTGVYLATKSFREDRDELIQNTIEDELLQKKRRDAYGYYEDDEDNEDSEVYRRY